MLIPLGLLGWLLMGVAVGWLGHVFLPSAKNRPVADVLSSLFGSIIGGVAATLLGFGGVAGFDIRGLVFATLAAMLLLLLARIPAGAQPSAQNSGSS